MNMFIRRLGRDELASRSVSSRGDGRRSNRHRRSSRCPRRDSIRRSRVQAKPCKRASVKSAVKSSVKSSTVGPTASEAAMKATAVEAASAKAAAVTATTLEAFGVRTQGVERLRDGHQICWAHVGRSSDGANILIGQQVVAGLRGPSPWLEQQFD